MEQPDLLKTRQEIRAHLIHERAALAPDVRKQRSAEIVGRLQSYLFQKRGASEASHRSIHCYISFRSEVETHKFIEQALHDGMRVTVPIVERVDTMRILLHTEISELSGLVGGAFGLQEPIERTPASLDLLDAVIIPLVAFDRNGTRLGYGKGFYDTFLHQLPRSVERIGLAFRMQEADFIPALPHDEPLDTVVTEHEIIHVTR